MRNLLSNTWSRSTSYFPSISLLTILDFPSLDFELVFSFSDRLWKIFHYSHDFLLRSVFSTLTSVWPSCGAVNFIPLLFFLWLFWGPTAQFSNHWQRLILSYEAKLPCFLPVYLWVCLFLIFCIFFFQSYSVPGWLCGWPLMYSFLLYLLFLCASPSTQVSPPIYNSLPVSPAYPCSCLNISHPALY